MCVSSSRAFVSAEKVLLSRCNTSSSALKMEEINNIPVSGVNMDRDLSYPSSSDALRSFKSTRPPVFNLNGSGWRVEERREEGEGEEGRGWRRGGRRVEERRGRKDKGEEEMRLKTLQIMIRML